MPLNEAEKAEIMRHIQDGLPLPDKYRFILFDEKREMELVWEGKSRDVCDAVLPFFITERVEATGKAVRPNENGWTDKLIRGDNKLILSSLINGPMREEIERAGGIKLIYIDPPFDVGTDFTIKGAGREGLMAYRDTWGAGKDSFIAMLYERLVLMRELLAPDGSLFLHCDWHVNSAIRLILDEIFGAEMHRNEIIHAYGAGGNPQSFFPRKHDTIYWYAKTGQNTFNKLEPIMRTPYDKSTLATHFRYTDEAGRRYRVQSKNGRDYITYEDTGKLVTDVWSDIGAQNATSPISKEYTGYPTQKAEKLLERILTAASNKGDLVADFFCGSGTMAAAASKLGRKWIATDIGCHAIQTTYKRLTGVQRQLQDEGRESRAFELLTMGKYERLYHPGVDIGMPEAEQHIQETEKGADYFDLVLRKYGASMAEGSHIHGWKEGRAVAVGPIDRAVTRKDIEAIIQECLEKHIAGIDILAFEYETGILTALCGEAHGEGMDIAYKYIPEDMFDSRATEGEAAFRDVYCIESSIQHKVDCAAVTLSGFHLCNKREPIQEAWAELIDYWAVDFHYGSRKQMIQIRNEQGVWEQRWTGEYIFTGEWMSCRTKQNKKIELTSDFIQLKPRGHTIAVKAVDVYGNETMRVIAAGAVNDELNPKPDQINHL